ncbi:MAG: hydrogenase expression protein HypE [Actinomycetota bacterium]|jgi:hydrogenase small subunit|nr:hydrogenase expression protein HypE [Rubrobacter sp.]MDQ3506686.1 hydrogenase expression protein HypE [Actinomycetota bacterium]
MTIQTPAVGVETPPERIQEPEAERRRVPEGPVKVVHAFWLAGMSCDGCSISATGATNPSVEDLMTGSIAGLPKVVLHHPVLSVEVGDEFIHPFELAAKGELDAPYVCIYEGSIADERIAAENGGYFSAMGDQVIEGGDRPFPTADRMVEMAPGAAAVIAIGTCATWGGIPAAAGNPTGSMSVMDRLGKDFRSALGLPVINIPGCAPVGDNFTETVAAILLFLQGMGPLPEFDELGRPAWLFNETVHRGCTRAGYYEEGVFAEDYGDKECLVEVGCWGPVVNCNIVSRGAQSHMGGCMAAGGPCIGCTMPGFPDKFAPFYKAPPGSAVSSAASRTVGFGMRRLRALSNHNVSREVRWDELYGGEVPSGWGNVEKPSLLDKTVHFFYEKLQFSGSKKPGRDDSDKWATDRPSRVRGMDAPHDVRETEGRE